MYIEYKNPVDVETAKRRIDIYVDKLNNLRFKGNFQIKDLNKSWTENEMQFSFIIKSSVLERRVQGVIKVKEDFIIIESELPTLIHNFITDDNLKSVILTNLDTALQG